MIVSSVRNFMRQCPLLNGDKRVFIDYLPDEIFQYSIDSIPSSTTVKKYVGGGEIKQFVFTFASKEAYGSDVITNIENCGFYEKVAEWIKDKSDNFELPELTGGKEPMYIEVLDSGYLFHAEESKARYQMQLRLVYYER